MHIFAKSLRPVLAALAALAVTAPAAWSQNFTFAGTFIQDDEIVQRAFTVLSPTTLILRTTSANVGGFDTLLSLFSADGTLVGADDDDDFGQGGFPAGALDAYLRLDLAPGEYRVAVSQSPNFFDTNTGQFLLAGQGNFTGGPFLDSTGVLRNGNFAVVAEQVIPEPGTALLAASSLFPLMVLVRRRRLS